MTGTTRHVPRWLAAAAVGLVVVPVLTAPMHGSDDDNALTELVILETVEAALAADGAPESAQLHTRLDAQGHGNVELLDPTAVGGLRERGRLGSPAVEGDSVHWDLDLTDGATTRQTVADYPTGELPISARVRYELDGEAVSAEELRGSSGDAVVHMQLRNPTGEPRGVLVGSGTDRRLEAVDIALPLLAEAQVQLDGSWAEVSADAGRVGADPEGVSVAWSAALFEPLGSTVTELEIRGRVDGASLPRIQVDATPVTAASSDLLATAADLLEDRATVDAVAAFLASTLADAFSGVGEGATQLASGLAELEAGLGETADFDMADPEALAQDALAGLADGLAPPAMDDFLGPDLLAPDLFDPDALDLDDLLADLDADALLAELDLDALLGEFDTAALLAGADFGALLEMLLGEALPDLPELDLDPAVIEAVLADVFDELGDDLALDELLAGLDLEALLAGIDLDEALAAALADLDLGAVFADVAEDLDLQALLAGIDFDTVLADLLGAVELGDVDELIPELIGDATLGDVLGEVDVDELVGLLTAGVDLEVEVAAALAALLDDLDIDLPAVGQEELDAVGEALNTALATVEGLLALTEHALDLLDEASGEVTPASLDEVAELGSGLAASLEGLGDAVGGVGQRLLDPVDTALGQASGRLDEAEIALAQLEEDLDPELADQVTAIRDAIQGAAGAVTTAQGATSDARAELEELSTRFDDLAEGTAALADALSDPELLAQSSEEHLDAIAEAISEVEAGLEGVSGELGALIATVEELGEELTGEVPLEELLTSVLLDQVDLEARLVDAGEELFAVLEDVRIDELLAAVGLAELLEELDLQATLEDLLAELELPDLATLLEEADLDLAGLLDELDVDLGEVLAGVDLSALLEVFDELDVDLAALLDDLEIEPAVLFDDLDLAALFDELDLTAVLGTALTDIDFGELDDLLGDVDLDLADLLAEAGLDPAELFADIELPDLSDLLPDLDFDAMLADLGLDPSALLADIELPTFEDLLGDLDLDFDALLAEAGLDDLGDLDEMIGGLMEALAGLAEGGDELADGLAQLTDEGLGQLVAQLDDDARTMERDLAALGVLERRAAEAQPTAPPEGADTAARYRLVFDPEEPMTPGAATLAALLAVGLAAEGLRRRWTG